MNDIIHKRDDGYIVTGFFTPDYRPLAERFSANLWTRGVSHHLYAVCHDDWQRAILQKPGILLRAMNEYPDRMIALMDVDCQVRGDIGPWVKAQTTDVTLPARIRQGSRRHGKVLFSSRVMVVAPTKPARRLVSNWKALCLTAKAPLLGRLCDERELVGAMSSEHGASISFSSDDYAGLDVRNAPVTAMIVHTSEHAKRHDNALTSIGKYGQRIVDSLRGKGAPA